MTSSENRNGIRILIAGGGTGGHLYPALAIAEEIRRQNPDAEFLFVGTHKKIEEKVVPSFGFKFKTIWISGFHRKVIISNLLFPLKVVVSFIQSLILILQFRPNVAVGTGGYVCGPILYTASFLRIPVLLHESNSYPGITTKLLASRATRIFLGFEAAKKYLKNNASFEVVGTPVRQNLNSASRQQALECFGLSSEKKIVLAFGGSQGAASINQAIAIGLDSGKCKDFQFIWQTGNNDYGIHKRYIRQGIWIDKFIDKMDLAYMAADIVVCRAGALTISELIEVKKPAILIPYPYAAEDHQTHNAEILVNVGAAVMIRDADVKSQLFSVIEKVLNDTHKLKSMSQSFDKIEKKNAANIIAKEVLEFSKEQIDA